MAEEEKTKLEITKIPTINDNTNKNPNPIASIISKLQGLFNLPPPRHQNDGVSEEGEKPAAAVVNLPRVRLEMPSLRLEEEEEEEIRSDQKTNPVVLWQVGSNSVQGAGAPTMFQAMKRIVGSLARDYIGEGACERAIRQSFLVSADMAHGVHPNYADKHEEHHRPELQKGLVIKHNASQRYATSGVTAFLFKEIARIHNLPTQEFVVRNDMGCGSTIGPILASGVGIRTVDCGIAQLSMHSVREICGKEDIDIAYKHFKAFYETFSSIDRKLNVD